MNRHLRGDNRVRSLIAMYFPVEEVPVYLYTEAHCPDRRRIGNAWEQVIAGGVSLCRKWGHCGCLSVEVDRGWPHGG